MPVLYSDIELLKNRRDAAILSPLVHADVEEFAFPEAEGGCEQRRRELLDAGVVFRYRVVEEPPRCRDLEPAGPRRRRRIRVPGSRGRLRTAPPGTAGCRCCIPISSC